MAIRTLSLFANREEGRGNGDVREREATPARCWRPGSVVNGPARRTAGKGNELGPKREIWPHFGHMSRAPGLRSLARGCRDCVAHPSLWRLCGGWVCYERVHM